MLLRYKTTDDPNTTFGLQAATGWGDRPEINKLDKLYLESTAKQFRYVDMGVITIGGDSFFSESIDRSWLTEFSLSIHATVIDGVTGAEIYTDNNTSFIYIDDMYLVPADKFLYYEIETPIGDTEVSKRIEVYGHESDAVYGMVVNRDEFSGIGSPLAGRHAVFETIAGLNSENWTMPTTVLDSKLVLVADSPISTMALSLRG